MTTPSDAPDTGRREFVKATITAAAAAPLILTSRKSDAQVAPVIPPSPSTIGHEWTMDLPIPATLQQSTLLPGPDVYGGPNTGGGECGRANHQKWDYLYSPQTTQTYEMHVRENPAHQFTTAAAIPSQTIWGYGGTYPGPTIHARHRTPILLRIHNDLPLDHVGFGSPEISTHLHNLHTGSESDGFPGDYYSREKKGPTLNSAGAFKDHFYSNLCAGFEDNPDTGGDTNEADGTLWFHDHTLDSTAANVYKGLAGFYLLFDELDSGNENDTNPRALRLPSGAYDVPLVVQDKRFSPDGQLFWDQLNPDGVLGDKLLVNGVIQPKLSVERRRYRFRILNGGPTRFYELYFIIRNTTQAQSFQYIANDGNLLTAPLASSALRNPEGASPHGIRLGVAERADIVFDFSRYPLGTEILLINRLNQLNTRKPEKNLLGIGAINTNLALRANQLMLIKVDRDPPGGLGSDPSRVPALLRPMTPTPTDLSNVPTRVWSFDRDGGSWTVNGRTFNVSSPRAVVRKGSAEIWDLRNPSGGWSHPIHVHFEEGRILERFNGDGVRVPVPAQERGRKDVYVLNPGERMRVFLRFRDFVGKYVMHCHNLSHEDHAMMVRWDIED